MTATCETCGHVIHWIVITEAIGDDLVPGDILLRSETCTQRVNHVAPVHVRFMVMADDHMLDVLRSRVGDVTITVRPCG